MRTRINTFDAWLTVNSSHSAPENALPFGAVKRLHIALERVSFHPLQDADDLMLDVSRQPLEIALGVVREFRCPAHS